MPPRRAEGAVMRNRFDADQAFGLPVLFGLAALLASLPVSAELIGLAHNAGNGSLQAVSIQSDSGAVTPGAAAASDCCLLPAGLAATDATGERFFAVGEWTGGAEAGNTALFEFAFDGASFNSISLAEVPRSVLAWDDQNNRLISLRQEPETVLLAIDSSDGSITALGGPATNCCEVVSGMFAMDSVGQRLFVAGRAFGASDWSLLAFNLASGAVSDVAVLPAGRPGFMLYDDSTGRVQMMMQTALADSGTLFAINPGSGAVDTLASYSNNDCCLYTPGDAASYSVDGEVVWVAGSDGANAPSILGQFASGVDRVIDVKALDSGYNLHAMVVDGITVVTGTIFWDRFEQP